MLDLRETSYHIHICGDRRLSNEFLFNFFTQSTDPPLTCTLNSSFSMDLIQKQTAKQVLVLRDCHNLETHSLLKKLHDDITTLPPRCQMACIYVKTGQKIEKGAIAIGARGVFYDNDTLDTIKKGVNAILDGQLWFSRDILSESVSDFVHNKGSQLPQHDLIAGLTRREKAIMLMIASGFSNEKIAQQLFISSYTVKTHVRNIYRKINVSSRVQAIFWANDNYLLLKE